jgi:ABC-type uncharacterized transport system involved in gliding motility auxiliary subunit
MEVKNAKNLQRRRRLKYGTNALLLTMSVVGLLVLAYVGGSRLHWRLDLTANQTFSLSEQTKGLLAALEQKVIVRAFFRKGGSPDQIYIRRKVHDFLTEYAEQSSWIDYAMYDPDVDSDATVAFGVQTDGTIVFQQELRRKDVYKHSLFDFSKIEDGSLPLFVGESAFSHAILSVSQAEQTSLCILKGHQERSLTDPSDPDGLNQIINDLKKENYALQWISMGENPDWSKICDVLLIAGPQRGFHRSEDESLMAFLKKGGKVFLMVDPQLQDPLPATLEYLKLRMPKAIVFDPKRHFIAGKHYPAPVLKSHPVTETIISHALDPIFHLARPIELMEQEEESALNVTVLLSSTEQSWGEKQLKALEKAERNVGEDLAGPLNLAVVISRSQEDGEKKPLAAVFGDSDFIANGLLAIPGNKDLFLNALAWLVGEEKNTMAIRPQDPDFRPLVMTPEQEQWVSLGTQFAYPAFFLLIGLFFWWRRRRR